MQRAVTGNVQDGAEKMTYSQDNLSISSADVPRMLCWAERVPGHLRVESNFWNPLICSKCSELSC